MRESGEYCHLTKAVENLGDRWSLLIVGKLARRSPQGFNALADDLPGISRSVLAERLRRLEELGLIARDPVPRGRVPGYCATFAGQQLLPVVESLREWALRWVPEDPAIAQRDPDLILWWLSKRIDPTACPSRPVVIDLDLRGGPHSKRSWLVLESDTEATICNEDPMLGEDRYVFVEADVQAIYPIARGLRSWAAAIADGSVELFGDPELIHVLPGWFTRAAFSGMSNQPVLSASA
jgi:DNA-binding HxlR family transcriptional regulator